MSSSSQQKPVPLAAEKDLREVVSQEFDIIEGVEASDDECRESCAIVLDAIDRFLKKWSELEGREINGGEADAQDKFPLGFLRETTSKIVREVGPGDTLFRTHWLEIVRHRSNTKSAVALEFVLEFLPCAALPNQEENNERKTGILPALDCVLDKDWSVLSCILDCVQRLVRTRRIGKGAAFQFVVKHVSKAQDDSIRRVTRSLMDLASSESDLSLAIQAIRTRSCCETEVLLFAEAITGISHECGRLDIFEEYLSIVEEQCNRKDPCPTESTLGCLDVLLLLTHRGMTKYGQTIELDFDHMTANGDINKQVLSSMARFARFSVSGAVLDEVNLAARGLRDLHDHLVWLLIFLCLGPIRSPKLITSEKILPLAKDFGVDLLMLSDQEGKHRIISAVLQISDELMSTMKESSNSSPCLPRSHGNSSSTLCVDASSNSTIQSVLFAMLHDVAEEIPHVLQDHMKAIIRLLRMRHIEDETVEKTCSIIVLVNKHTRTGLCNDSPSDPVFLARTLLFSRDSPCDSEEIAVKTWIKGMMLVSKMLSLGYPTPTEISLLWQSVRSVLLPPTNRLAHPRCGSFGLVAMRSFCVPEQGRNKTAMGFLSPGIFDTLTSILMASRLVHYTNTPKKGSRQNNVFCYSDRPHCFEHESSKQRKSQKMIFSSGALQSDYNFSCTSNWELSTKFVFDLTDAYLGLGRMISKGKWIPHAWVEASFEIPLIDLSNLRATNSKQQRMMDLVRGTLIDFDPSRDSVATKGSSDKEFNEILKQAKRSERTEVVQCLLRSTMSYCLGLALSASILQNTFEHYKGVLDEQDHKATCQQRVEATRLMQYQLAKIYDLAGKCQIMETVFRGISNANLRTKNRRKKPGRGGKIIGLQFENMELHTDIRIASEQLKKVLGLCTSTDEYVKSKVLWYCLADPSHDIILIKKVEITMLNYDANTAKCTDHYDVILGLRLNIIHHLTRHLQRFSERNRDDNPLTPPHLLIKELAGMQPFFAQCLRLTAFFLSKLAGVPGGDHGMIRAERLVSLTAAYVRLLLVSMEICLDSHSKETLQEINQKSKLPGFNEFSGLYRSILGAKRPLTDAIAMEDDLPQNPVSFKSTINSFLRHLTKCTDSTIATEILETLSVLSLNSKQDEAVIEMVRISWTALHSKFLGEVSGARTTIPFALVEALKHLSPGAMLSSNHKTAKDSAIRETVLKSAFGKSKFQEPHCFLVQGMLRHWGFLALSEHLTPSSADHLHQLYATLQNFLGEVNETIVPKQRIQKDEDLSGEDDEYLPPKRPQSIKPSAVLPDSVIPYLNQWSYVAYFQTLLDMAVSSCALFNVNNNADWHDSLNGPYTELCKLVETFGSLVILYQKRIHVFPQQAMPSILNACRSMLNVVSYQSTQCIEWRSSQPVLTFEQIEAKAVDPASVQFLAKVFDSFGINIVGTLDALCDSIESFSTPGEHPNGGKIFGVSQKQKVRALRLKIDKISSDLEKSAVAHKLSAPRRNVEESEDGQPTQKRRRIEIKGFLQFEESAEESSIVNKNIEASSELRTDIVTRTIIQSGQNDEFKTISSELTWEEGSSGDDSFGADGDWGRESEEEDGIRIKC